MKSEFCYKSCDNIVFKAPRCVTLEYSLNFALKAMKPKIKGPIIAGNEAHKKAAFKQGDCNNEVMI